jgi:two-component system response regulator HydG
MPVFFSYFGWWASPTLRPMSATRILIVDDEAMIRESLSMFLQSRGYKVGAATSGQECIAAIQQHRYDLILLDLNMTPMNGFDTLEKIRGETPHTYICILTAADDESTRKRALSLGADGFIGKNLSDPEGMNEKIRIALAEAERRVFEQYSRHGVGKYDLVGDSPTMRRVYDLIRRAAPTSTTILILGDTGTGKELVAQALHRESTRRDKPFVAINCAAIAEPLLESEMFGHVKGAFTGADKAQMGKYEAADKGTLFLDEISKSSLAFQSKLLRLLETHRFTRVGATQETSADVRLITASNARLNESVKHGQFLIDLYYRINVFPIDLPPLRDRAEDIALLVHHFLRQFCKARGAAPPRISPALMTKFETHTWPGNIRELRNMLERAMLLTDGANLADPFGPELTLSANDKEIDCFHLPFKEAQKEFERQYLEKMLKKNGGNRKLTAEEAGIDPATLFRKLKRQE